MKYKLITYQDDDAEIPWITIEGFTEQQKRKLSRILDPSIYVFAFVKQEE
jgi:hypothetical protein